MYSHSIRRVNSTPMNSTPTPMNSTPTPMNSTSTTLIEDVKNAIDVLVSNDNSCQSKSFSEVFVRKLKLEYRSNEYTYQLYKDGKKYLKTLPFALKSDYDFIDVCYLFPDGSVLYLSEKYGPHYELQAKDNTKWFIPGQETKYFYVNHGEII